MTTIDLNTAAIPAPPLDADPHAAGSHLQDARRVVSRILDRLDLTRTDAGVCVFALTLASTGVVYGVAAAFGVNL